MGRQIILSDFELTSRGNLVLAGFEAFNVGRGVALQLRQILSVIKPYALAYFSTYNTYSCIKILRAVIRRRSDI